MCGNRIIALNLSVLVAILVTSFPSPADAESLSRQALSRLKEATAFIKVKGTGLEQRCWIPAEQVERFGILCDQFTCAERPGRKQATQISVVLNSGTPSERSLSAEVVGDDASADLAVLRVRASELPDAIPSDSSPEIYETLDVSFFRFSLW